MNNLKALLFDLDGTLLTDEKTISQRNVNGVKFARSKNILIGFSTLRGISTIKKYIEIIRPDFMVLNGGAIVIVGDQQIFSSILTLDETRKLLATSYELLGRECEITVDTVDKIYWNRKLDKSQRYANSALYDDMLDFKENATKLCVQTWDADIADKIANSIDDCQGFKFSDIPWYSFAKKDATKANAVKHLSRHVNIKVSEIVAFGDDYTDIGMLQLCGIGVAMGNAIDEVKNVADEITADNNNDGVAVWIEKNIR